MDETKKRTIVYDAVRVLCWRYDPELERVVASYETLDTAGHTIERGESVFWATLPPATLAEDGKTLIRPANWHQMDIRYLQSLIDLTVSMQATLTPKLTEEKAKATK